MLNYTFYADESGHSEDPKLYYAGMAGFVAPAATWEVFDQQWREHMRIAGFTESFHMWEFAHRAGQFQCFKEPNCEPKRKLFFARLIEILLATNATPIGAVVSLRDFESLTELQQGMFMNPYYVAFQICTHGAAIEAAFDDPNETVAMVYSYNGEYGTNKGGLAEKLWRAIKENYNLKDKIASYASSAPAQWTPLQAADLFAYELCHEFENQVKRPNDPMRWGMKRILEMCGTPLPRIRLLDRLELLRIVKESSLPDQTGVEEVPDGQMYASMARTTRWMSRRGGVEFHTRF